MIISFAISLIRAVLPWILFNKNKKQKIPTPTDGKSSCTKISLTADLSGFCALLLFLSLTNQFKYLFFLFSKRMCCFTSVCMARHKSIIWTSLSPPYSSPWMSAVLFLCAAQQTKAEESRGKRRRVESRWRNMCVCMYVCIIVCVCVGGGFSLQRQRAFKPLHLFHVSLFTLHYATVKTSQFCKIDCKGCRL